MPKTFLPFALGHETGFGILFWNQNESHTTISQASADFFVHLAAASRAAATIECYRRDLRRLERALEDTRISGITDAMLDRAVLTLGQAPSTGSRLASASMNRMKSVWKSFFAWCYISHRMFHGPSRMLNLAKSESKRTAAFHPNEIHVFLSAIRGSTDRPARRDEALFAVYAFTGMRRSEALGLRLGDYDQEGKRLKIRVAKGTSARTCAVPFVLAKILDRYLEAAKTERQLSETAPLFPGKSPSQPLSPRRAQARFHHWRRLSGIRSGVTIRSFRAGFGTMLHRAGVDSISIARALGHVDCRMTERYIDEDHTALRTAIDRAMILS